MPEYITINEIAELIGMNKSSVIRRSVSENWPHVKTKVRGGYRKDFIFARLPESIRLLYNKVETEKALVPIQTEFLPAAPQKNPGMGPAITEKQRTLAMAKADLLRKYLDHMERAPWGQKGPHRDEFMRAYNSGLAFPFLYNVFGQLSWKTIESWKQTVRRMDGDVFYLADMRGKFRRGQTLLTEPQQKILLSCALHPHKPHIAEAVRMAKAIMATKNIPNGYSEATYRRWLNKWVETNYHIWIFSREGAKAWNDKVAMYIERDYNLINVGDILIADGHVLNFEILNPWTGKPKRMALILWYDMKSNYPCGWEIMPTEDTRAIASALRRAILRLGMFPKVAYIDNGKAFKSRFFTGATDLEQDILFGGLYERLGIRPIFAWPYHGQSKTIERFFGTFAELERWAPTYCGTSIENKPPRMMRGERVHRRVHEKIMGGGCITLEQAHMAIAAWFDVYAQRPQRGHLEGACPLEVFLDGKGPGVDSAGLHYMMMSQEVRHINRNGIHFLGQNYYDPELYGRRHGVTIRFDLQDTSEIYVFDGAGEFICSARPMEKCHPAANVLGDETHREQLVEHIKEKKRQERDASSMAVAFLEDHVLPEHKRMLENSGIDGMGQPAKVETKPLPRPAIDHEKFEAEVAEITEINRVAKLELYPEEQETPINFMEEVIGSWSRLEELNMFTRYKHLGALEILGVMIPREQRDFMVYYESTDEYRRNEDRFEQHKMEMLTKYQMSEKIVELRERAAAGEANG